jgi:hypothetical protein
MRLNVTCHIFSRIERSGCPAARLQSQLRHEHMHDEHEQGAQLHVASQLQVASQVLVFVVESVVTAASVIIVYLSG